MGFLGSSGIWAGARQTRLLGGGRAQTRRPHPFLTGELHPGPLDSFGKLEGHPSEKNSHAQTPWLSQWRVQA